MAAQVRVNFPNGDMVGHTGKLEATIAACTATDKAVKVDDSHHVSASIGTADCAVLAIPIVRYASARSVMLTRTLSADACKRCGRHFASQNLTLALILT